MIDKQGIFPLRSDRLNFTILCTYFCSNPPPLFPTVSTQIYIYIYLYICILVCILFVLLMWNLNPVCTGTIFSSPLPRLSFLCSLINQSGLNNSNPLLHQLPQRYTVHKETQSFLGTFPDTRAQMCIPTNML
jgi:hypothetical protein